MPFEIDAPNDQTFHASPVQNILILAARGVRDDAGAPPPPKPPEPKPPRKKRFKLGDRVTTSYGTVTVAEVDGKKYLVDLDGQSARLWTEDWALRKA